MKKVSKRNSNLFFIIYINDILIYSSNEVEHVNHLRFVLQTLKHRQLFASKWEFLLQPIAFLWDIVYSEGIILDY